MSNKSAPVTVDKNDTKNTAVETNTTETNYVKEIIKDANEHIELIAFCCTVLIAFLNLCVYAYERGRCKYWGIDTSNIDISNGNFIYSLFLYIAIAVVVFFLNRLVYLALTEGKINWKKILGIICIIIGVAIVYAAILFVPTITDSDVKILDALMNWNILRIITVYSLLLSIFTLCFGFSFVIADKIVNKLEHKKKAAKDPKDTKEDDGVQQCNAPPEEDTNVPATIVEEKSGINRLYYQGIFASIALAICILMSCWVGYKWESSKKDTGAFKVIGETQVVVYEGTDFFIVSNCEVSEDKTITSIDKTVQTRIEKNNVVTTLMKFEKSTK